MMGLLQNTLNCQSVSGDKPLGDWAVWQRRAKQAPRSQRPGRIPSLAPTGSAAAHRGPQCHRAFMGRSLSLKM